MIASQRQSFIYLSIQQKKNSLNRGYTETRYSARNIATRHSVFHGLVQAYMYNAMHGDLY